MHSLYINLAMLPLLNFALSNMIINGSPHGDEAAVSRLGIVCGDGHLLP
jgi:hypothetical protein